MTEHDQRNIALDQYKKWLEDNESTSSATVIKSLKEWIDDQENKIAMLKARAKIISGRCEGEHQEAFRDACIKHFMNELPNHEGKVRTRDDHDIHQEARKVISQLLYEDSDEIAEDSRLGIIIESICYAARRNVGKLLEEAIIINEPGVLLGNVQREYELTGKPAYALSRIAKEGDEDQ